MQGIGMTGEQYATEVAKPSVGGSGRTTGGRQYPTTGSETPDEIRRRELERYLVRRADGSGPRPSVGAAVPITVDESDCERARIALRRLSGDVGVPGGVESAAISLEISLERPLDCVRRRNRPVTLEFDVADCALMALALLHASDCYRDDDDPDAYRRQARRILERIDRSRPESLDARSPVA